jgi:hypothetical protein
LECGFPGWLDLTQPPIFRIPKPFLIEFITASRQADEIARAVQQEREARVQKLRQELNIGPEIARYLQNLELRIENLERRPRS